MKALLFTALLSLIGAAVCGVIILITKRLKISARTTEALLFGALVLPFLAALGYFALRPMLPEVTISVPTFSATEQANSSAPASAPTVEEIFIPMDVILPEFDFADPTDVAETHTVIPAPTPVKPAVPAAPVVTPEPVATPEKLHISFNPRILTLIWLAVAAIALIKLFVDYLSAIRALKRARVYAYDFNGVPVYRLRAVTAPMLAGILDPAVYIPFGETSDLTLALRHELAHLGRRDILKKLILEAIGALVWFNPIWHLAKRATLRRAELACDEKILSGETYAARRQYAETVMSFAGCTARRGLAAQLSSGGENLKTRLENIMDDKPAKKRPLVVAATVTVLLLVTATVCVIVLPPKGRAEARYARLFNDVFSDYDQSSQYPVSEIKEYSFEITNAEKTGDASEEMRNFFDNLLSEHFTAYMDGEEVAIKDARLTYDAGYLHLDGKTLLLEGECGKFQLKRCDDFEYELFGDDGALMCTFNFITDSPFHAAEMILHDEDDFAYRPYDSAAPVTNFDGSKPVYDGLSFNYAEYSENVEYFDEYLNEYDIPFDANIYDRVVSTNNFVLRGRTYLFEVSDTGNDEEDIGKCLSRIFNGRLKIGNFDFSAQRLVINGAPLTVKGDSGTFTIQRTGTGTFVINDEQGYLYTIGISVFGSSGVNPGYGIHKVRKSDAVGDPNAEILNALIEDLELRQDLSDDPDLIDILKNEFYSFKIGDTIVNSGTEPLESLRRDGWNLFTLTLDYPNGGSASYFYAEIPYSLMSPRAADMSSAGSSYTINVSNEDAVGDPDKEIRNVLQNLFGEYTCFYEVNGKYAEVTLKYHDLAIGEELKLKGSRPCLLTRNSYYTFTFTDEKSAKHYYTIIPYSSKSDSYSVDTTYAESVRRWEADAQAKAEAVMNEWIVSYQDDGTPIYEYPDWWAGWYRNIATMYIRIVDITPEIEEYITSRIDMTNVKLVPNYLSYNEVYSRYQQFIEIYEAEKDDPESPFYRILTVSFDEELLGVKIEFYSYADEQNNNYINHNRSDIITAMRDREIYMSYKIIEHQIPDGESLENALAFRVIGGATGIYDGWTEELQKLIDWAELRERLDKEK